MSSSISLQMKQQQKLVMTPQLHQAIAILQLSTIELAQKIEEELIKNPVLEEAKEERQENLKSAQEEANPETIATDIENLNQGNIEKDDLNELYFEDSSDTGYSSTSSDTEYSYTSASSFQDSDEKQKYIEQKPDKPPSLNEHLLWQLRIAVNDNEILRLGELLISFINSDGYLSINLEDFQTEYNISAELANDLLSLIQTFEPYGVGARNLKECLLIQLYHQKKVSPWVEQIVENFLEDVRNKNYKRISKHLGISLDAVIEAIGIISKLEPIPGRQYISEKAKYIIPDILIEKIDNEFFIIINDDWIPKIKISQFYSELLKNASKKENIYEYLREKVNAAGWLIKSIDQRRNTMYKVMKSILDIQIDFFKKGPKYIKPLTLKDIADVINMHESTVGRVTTDKYVQTPWGIYELKFFFSSKLHLIDGGETSSRRIMELMKDIISEEPESKPFSDQDIVKILNERGIIIARRTVAKYRKKLKILPASARKKKNK